MSKERRLRRLKGRIVAKRFSVLGDLLMGFYSFLDSKPKPEDAQVRSEYIRREQYWRRYCKSEGIPDAADMFKKEVAVSWRERYTKPMPTTSPSPEEK